LLATHLTPTCSLQTAAVVVCRAQQQNLVAKAAAAGVSIPALLAAHPALALVDNRLATEGTGKIFGINDSALFWNMLVRGAQKHVIWALRRVETARKPPPWQAQLISAPPLPQLYCRPSSAPCGPFTTSASATLAAMMATRAASACER